ncbi:N-acetylglucosamine kinase [Fusibacter sp. JL298sf-3]
MSVYYIGMDGGGSNTVVAISDGSDVLCERHFPATNYHNVGIETVKSVIKIAIETMLEEVGAGLGAVKGICLGGAGVDTLEDEKRLREAIRATGYTGPLVVVNDAVTALVGANGKKEGAVIISGTGSIAIGIKEDAVLRVGGWGHIIGDEGSGYSISRDAFKAASMQADGRLEKTVLYDTIAEVLDFQSPDDIIAYLYDGQRGKDDVAALTKSVLPLYHDDPVVKKIVDRNIDDLVEMVKALARRMENDAFHLSVAGSVLTKSTTYYALFKQALGEVLPNVDVSKSKNHPVIGALELAKRGH